MFEGNASYLYIGNVARSTDTLAGMASGSIAIVNEAGAVQTSTIMSSNANYRIAQKLASGKLIYSDWFNPTKIKGLTGKSYDAPVQQVSYLGYNGTTGALDATAGGDYVVHIEWKNTAGAYNNKPLLISGAWHLMAASQEELATGLLQNLGAAMKRQAYKFVKIERVSNGTLAEFDNDVTVVNGSKAITFATDTSYGGGSTALAVGDYVSLRGITYKVAAVNSLVVTLDSEYRGSSETIAVGSTTDQAARITSITAWGLKFTGVDNPAFDPINDQHSLTRFDILLNSEFTTATVTYATKPYDGIGAGREIAVREVYSQFLDKSPFISAYPRNNYRAEADKTGTYDVMTFEVNDPVTTSVATGLTTNKRVTFTIATKVALDGDGVDAVLGFTL